MQEFEAERRHRQKNGSGDGGPPRRTLWDVFNDKISDMTKDLRLHARSVIADEIQRRKNEFPPTLDSAQRARHEAEISALSQKFTAVVNGGVRGSCVAFNTLRVLKPRAPSPL